MDRRHASNWFDHCRLFFAALVIFSHSFALTGYLQPPLTLGFATDFGKIAVGCFLILSGYLISQAWERRRGTFDYLRNRVLRIFPAYAAAMGFSVVAALAVGGSVAWTLLPRDILTLAQPHADFPAWLGSPTNANGSLWSISLEFTCYLLAPFLTRSRWVLAAAWLVVAVLLLRSESGWLRGILMFLSGAAYHRFDLAPKPWLVALCAVALIPALRGLHAWDIGLALAGGYVLLSLGRHPCAKPLSADISYGVYLYGWPVQKLLIWTGVSNPWLLAALALPAAGALGLFSWLAIEQPALRLKTAMASRRTPLRTAPAAP
jgi:peptidoglycan/LPS O-acetylase OafA/YrhL